MLDMFPPPSRPKSGSMQGLQKNNFMLPDVPVVRSIGTPGDDWNVGHTAPNPLRILLEEAILPFGFVSLNDLAEIPVRDEATLPVTPGGLRKNASHCQKCKLYEDLLRTLSTLLIIELDERKADSCNGNMPTESPTGLGDFMTESNTCGNGGRAVVTFFAECARTGPTTPRASLATSFPSVTSLASSLLTSGSRSLSDGSESWLQGFLTPITSDTGTGLPPLPAGTEMKCRKKCPGQTSPVSQTGIEESFIEKPLNRGSRVPQRGTKYLSRGASYSLSTACALDELPPVIETGKTVIARNNNKKMINDYVVMRQIGHGTTGSVALVQHQKTMNLYAMKIIRLGNKVSERRVNAIRSEINIMKAVSHPHVVRLHEVIGDKGRNTIFLILQYVSGGSIARPLSPTTIVPVPEAQLRLYTSQILSALKYLHSNGIFHRDIKPDNILIDENKSIFLADFGVSAISSANGVLGVEGTPAFMAPEVCSGKLEVMGELVDVWALGVTMYQLMYGFLPFRASTFLNMTREIVNTPVMFPDEVERDEDSDKCASSTMPQLDTLKRKTDTSFSLPSPPRSASSNRTEEGRIGGAGYDAVHEMPQSTVVSSPEFKILIRGVLCKDPDSRWTLRRIGESEWLRGCVEERQRNGTLNGRTGVLKGPTTDKNISRTAVTHKEKVVANGKSEASTLPPIRNTAGKFLSDPKKQDNGKGKRDTNKGKNGSTDDNHHHFPHHSHSLEMNDSCLPSKRKIWKRFFPASWGGKPKIISPRGCS